ncbi:hypothetical protein ES708_07890 [subsurface metagenome]
MNAILKGEGSFTNPRNHGGNLKPIGLLVIAVSLGVLLLSNCGWDDTLLDSSWIRDYWVHSYYAAPYSDLLHFEEGGNYYRYEDYDHSILIQTGTWALTGDILTMDSTSTVITKISDDQYSKEGITYYKRDKEPGGWIFDQTPTALTYGIWESDSILFQTLKLYSFTAQVAGDYEIYWDDDFNGSDTTTSDIIVSAYRADENTPIFTEEDDGYDYASTATLDSGEAIYIIVDADYKAGSFRIMVN